MPDIRELVAKVEALDRLRLMGVGVAANWLGCQVIPLKQQVHPAWEYSDPSDPTREVADEIPPSVMERCLRELFQDCST